MTKRNKKIVAYLATSIFIFSSMIGLAQSAVVPTADSFCVEDASGETGTYVFVPVKIANVVNGTVFGIRIKMDYDENVLELMNVSSGDLTSAWTLQLGVDKHTILIATAFSGDAIPEGSSGSVVLLNFHVLGSPGDISPVNMTHIELSDLDGNVGTVPAKNGTFYVSSATCSPVRDMPSTVEPGESFNVTVTWTFDEDNSNSVGLHEEANATANMSVTVNGDWCNPAIFVSNTPDDYTAEYTWLGPYNSGQTVTAVYKVDVPPDALPGTYTFHGYVIYYVGATKHTVPIGGTSELAITGSTAVFDTKQPANPYPSIMGTHEGTITPSHDLVAANIFAYSCEGTGGHIEYVKIWNSTWLEGIEAQWQGYQSSDYPIVKFQHQFSLVANQTYNYTIRTGAYPQIWHAGDDGLKTGAGVIECSRFIDANGRSHKNWIPAFRLY